MRTERSFFDRLLKGLAYYPLTFYFGALFLLAGGLVLYAHRSFGLELNLTVLWQWVLGHQTLLLSVVTILLGTTLVASAVAYRKVCNLSREDYIIWLEQRSTRTLFPFFTPLHDWLRIRIPLYRWWHTRVFASSIHYLALFILAAGIFSSGYQTLGPTVIVSPGPSEDGSSYFEIQGIGSSITAGTAATITITAYDAEGTVLKDYSGTVTFTSTDSQAILPANYTFQDSDEGSKTFNSGVTLKTAGTRTVTVRDTVDTSMTGTHANVTVNPAAAASFAVTTASSSVTAGSAFTLTATAKDSYNNTATGYTGTVTFTSSDTQAVLPANYTFTGTDAGIKAFTNGVTLKTAGSRSVTVRDTVQASRTGSTTLTVSPAKAAEVNLEPEVSPITAGNAFAAKLTIYDSYGNVATNFSGEVSFSSTDSKAVAPDPISLKGGETEVSGFVLKTAGVSILAASIESKEPLTGETKVEVVANVPAKIIATSKTRSVVAGNKWTLSLAFSDAYDNPVTYEGTLVLSTDDKQSISPEKFTPVKQSNELLVTFTKSGSRVLQLRDSQQASLMTELKVNVLPSTIDHYTISVGSAAQAANSVWSATVKAYDRYDNLADNDSTTQITPQLLSSIDAKQVAATFYSAVGGNTVTGYKLSAGTATLYIQAVEPGSYRLSVTDANGKAGTSAVVTISQAGQTSLLEQPPQEVEEVITPVPVSDEGHRATAVTPGNIAVFNEVATLPEALSYAAVLSSVLVAVSAAPTAAAAASLGVNMLIQGLSIAQLPLVAGAGRRRRRWGTVRTTATGLATGGVFVDLFTIDGQRVGHVMTDRNGQYAFIVPQAGEYYLEIQNPLYQPYRSANFTVNDPKRDLVDLDIWLVAKEPALKSRLASALRLVKFAGFVRLLNLPLLILGTVAALSVAYHQLTLVSGGVLLLYVAIWLLQYHHLRYRRPYGAVVDAKTRLPQPLSIVQLIDSSATGQRVVRSTITDTWGRFLFVVPPGKYTLIAAKENYQPTEIKIAGDDVNYTVALQPNR